MRHTSECGNTLSCEEASLLYVCIREGWDGSNSGLFVFGLCARVWPVLSEGLDGYRGHVHGCNHKAACT